MLRIRESRRYHDSLKRVTFGEIPNSKPEHYRHFSNDEPVFDEDLQGISYHNNWKDFVETTSTYKISGKMWEFAEILEKMRQNCKWNSDFAPGSQINQSPDFGPLARIPNSYELEHLELGSFGTRPKNDSRIISPSRSLEYKEDVFSKSSNEEKFRSPKTTMKEPSKDLKNNSMDLVPARPENRPEIHGPTPTSGESTSTSGKAFEISKMLESITSNWAKRHIEKFPYSKEYQLVTDSMAEMVTPGSLVTKNVIKTGLTDMPQNESSALQPIGSREMTTLLQSNVNNVTKEMMTFGLQNSRGDKISVEVTCVTAYVNRFWDWDLFCLADENGFGLKFITIRIWRENVSCFNFRSTSGLLPVDHRLSGDLG